MGGIGALSPLELIHRDHKMKTVLYFSTMLQNVNSKIAVTHRVFPVVVI